MATERKQSDRGDVPAVGPDRVVFHDDYDFSVLLEPDGTVRRLLHVQGVDGIDLVDSGRRTVVEYVRLAVGGERGAAEWEERLDRLRTTMEPVNYRMVRPGSAPGQPETVFCVATPIPSADGTLDAILLQTQDRSTALKIEAQLRASEAAAHEHKEQLRAALEVTGLGRFTLDIREEVATGDARLSEIFGTDVPELIRTGGMQAWFDMIHVDDVDHVRRAVEIAASGGPDYDVEYRLWRSGDLASTRELRWIAARGRMEVDENGPYRMVGVIEDITSRRAEETARLLSQKREAIGTLAGGVAHDFNNVISAILSNAAVARTELAAGASPATSISEIARGAERAADIARRLLAFSREEPEVRAAFDLATVVGEACTLSQATLPPSVQLRFEAQHDLPPVYGASSELHQLVINLINNAAGFADPAHGEILVDVRSGTDPAHGPGTVVLRVFDNGPGVSPSIRHRIFDPFFTTKGVGEGTGLGLASAHTIVQSHAGEITANDAPGGGAVFTVVLPASELPLPAPSGSSEPSVEPNRPTRLRVLFVDDEPALVMLAERALPHRGFSVHAFTGPEAALDAYTADPSGFDAVVTDLSMPGMDGLDLIGRVREHRPELPAVLSSGFITPETKTRAESLLVDAIVPKPCSIDDLADALLRVCGPVAD